MFQSWKRGALQSIGIEFGGKIVSDRRHLAGIYLDA